MKFKATNQLKKQYIQVFLSIKMFFLQKNGSLPLFVTYTQKTFGYLQENETK